MNGPRRLPRSITTIASVGERTAAAVGCCSVVAVDLFARAFPSVRAIRINDKRIIGAPRGPGPARRYAVVVAAVADFRDDRYSARVALNAFKRFSSVSLTDT